MRIKLNLFRYILQVLLNGWKKFMKTWDCWSGQHHCILSPSVFILQESLTGWRIPPFSWWDILRWSNNIPLWFLIVFWWHWDLSLKFWLQWMECSSSYARWILSLLQNWSSFPLWFQCSIQHLTHPLRVELCIPTLGFRKLGSGSSCLLSWGLGCSPSMSTTCFVIALFPSWCSNI